MKLYHYLLILLAFASGWLVEWLNSPLARPLCLDRGADVFRLIAGMPAGYVLSWSLIAAGVMLPTWALLAWVGASLHRLARP